MSRSKRGGKGPGYEYGSRRPDKAKFSKPGAKNKKITHKKERRAANDITND